MPTVGHRDANGAAIIAESHTGLGDRSPQGTCRQIPTCMSYTRSAIRRDRKPPRVRWESATRGLIASSTLCNGGRTPRQPLTVPRSGAQVLDAQPITRKRMACFGCGGATRFQAATKTFCGSASRPARKAALARFGSGQTRARVDFVPCYVLIGLVSSDEHA
jgi:hypothetical protein